MNNQQIKVIKKQDRDKQLQYEKGMEIGFLYFLIERYPRHAKDKINEIYKKHGEELDLSVMQVEMSYNGG